jgi:hypothetical protein
MDPKNTALTLLKIAATLFPPLAELLSDLLRDAGSDNPLVDEVRSSLPSQSASERAQHELGG